MADGLYGILTYAALALLVAGLAGMAYGLRRVTARLEDQGRRLAAQEQILQGLCAGARGLGDSVRVVERNLKGMQHRLDDLDQREPGPDLYRRAIERARKGAPPRELVENYGLEPGEAELLTNLHGRTPEGVA